MELVDNLTLEEIDQRIARTAVEAAIEIGYYLKQIRDRELYKQAGCRDVYEYAQKQYGYDRSTTSRNMSRNDRFSVGGNSPELAEKYLGYGKSQLQEMISMTDEQLGQVKPDMTVREMKDLKKKPEKAGKSGRCATSQQQEKDSCPPDVHECSRQEWGTSEKQQEQGRKECKKCWEHWKQLHRKEVPELEENGKTLQETVPEERQLSAYGLPVLEYPPDSLIADFGCGEFGGILYHCFGCHMNGCRIRGKECYCVEAPMGNPFPCKTLLLMEQDSVKQTVKPHICQFMDHSLADHRAGDGSAVPCCKKCGSPCRYQCDRARAARAKEQEEEPESGIIDGECREVEDLPEKGLYEETSDKTDRELAQAELDRENKTLKEMLEAFTENDWRVRKHRIMVTALSGFICDLENLEIPELIQPELPVLRNNDQRREWLRSYKDWGLWYEDANIGAKYYKYDFDNGARLIVEVYEEPKSERWHAGYVGSHFHLVGGPKSKHNKWSWHERYSKYPNSETELVEFLKEVQRNG